MNLFVPDKGSDAFSLHNHFDSCVSCGEHSVYICDIEKCGLCTLYIQPNY